MKGSHMTALIMKVLWFIVIFVKTSQLVVTTFQARSGKRQRGSRPRRTGWTLPSWQRTEQQSCGATEMRSYGDRGGRLQTDSVQSNHSKLAHMQGRRSTGLNILIRPGDTSPRSPGVWGQNVTDSWRRLNGDWRVCATAPSPQLWWPPSADQPGRRHPNNQLTDRHQRESSWPGREQDYPKKKLLKLLDTLKRIKKLLVNQCPSLLLGRRLAALTEHTGLPNLAVKLAGSPRPNPKTQFVSSSNSKIQSKPSNFKLVLCFAIFALCSFTKSFQLSQLWSQTEGTDNRQQMDIATYRLNRPMGQFSENIEIWLTALSIMTLDVLHLDITHNASSRVLPESEPSPGHGGHIPADSMVDLNNACSI